MKPPFVQGAADSTNEPDLVLGEVRSIRREGREDEAAGAAMAPVADVER